MKPNRRQWRGDNRKELNGLIKRLKSAKKSEEGLKYLFKQLKNSVNK